MTGVVVPFPPAYRQQIGEDDLDKVDSELASIDKELERVARARKGLMLRLLPSSSACCPTRV
jgi:hypothetical protein